jgi:serine/threonine protein phosphatase 1
MAYIIGDLHSNYVELNKLLSIIKPRKSDRFIFVGDYIDKNIGFKEIINLLYELNQKYKCIFIKGNHEFVWEQYVVSFEKKRQDFLFNYGGILSLSEFCYNPEIVLKNNQIEKIKEFLKKYFDLFPLMLDYFLVDDFLVLHAGLLDEQLDDELLEFKEINYFLRPDKINPDRRYLNKYRLVCGHTFLDEVPTIKPAYVNIDLGAGYGRYLGCLDTNKKKVIRSDNKIFNV